MRYVSKEEFEKMEESTGNGTMVDWETEYKSMSGKIVYMSDYVEKVSESYGVNPGTVRNRLNKWKRKGLVEVRKTRVNGRVMGVVRFK